MADVAGAVGGLLTCLCAPNCLNTPVVEQCKYAMNHSGDIEELGNIKATLIAHKEDMSKRLDASEVNEGKTRSRVVTNWLEDVDRVLKKANAIEEKVTKAKQGLARLIPSCCSHSRMGPSISRLLKEAADLVQRYGGISDEAIALMKGVRGTEYPIENIIGETTALKTVEKVLNEAAKLLDRAGGISSESFTVLEGGRGKEYPVEKIIGKTTALKTIEMVWDYLMNDEIRTIGVHGMGGVGKTTIVTEINNRLIKQEHLFESVIWVTVSKSTSIRQIQACIAREIDLTLRDDEDERKISASLFGALKRRKKFLLILDDMWEDVSLPKIGIPDPTEENGCKVLLTTRLLEVCRKMGCREQSTISVGLLTKNEAWELFIDRLGVELSEEKREIAEDLVEECARLPLAIITVGGAMQEYNDIAEWRLALNDLRGYEGEIIDMEERVFKCLKLSYDRLPGDRFRKCFLLCALYPEDYNIRTQELIEYWIMGGMIEGRDGQDEIDKGKHILNKLKNHCLLVSVDHTEEVPEREKELNASVKMHDLIRDMALQFANVLVKDGVFLKSLPNEAEWREDLEGASFMNNEIEDISLSPKCPKLSILLLHSDRLNWSLRSISDCFFLQMQGLRVLDLGGNAGMKSLPNSISDLVNLRALLLNGCYKLKCLPSLSKLQSLRILDLEENYALESLPDSISDLTELVELRLSKCYNLERVPSVAKLHRLRTLQLGGTHITELPHGMWKLVNLKLLEMEPLKKLKSRGGLVEGLLSMKDLEFLDIRFASVSECADFVGSPNYMGLKDFRIEIRSEQDIGFRDKLFPGRNRILDVYVPADGPYTANFVPKNTESLRIERFNDIRSLNDFKCQLRACTVICCDQLESIIKQEEGECSLLESMEELDIRDCPELHSVYDGIPSTTQHLKQLKIVECGNLKNVFSSPRLLQQLQNLEHLIIGYCFQVEEVIKSPTEEASNIITLPKLKTLEFNMLWELKNIWSGEMVCNSLQVITVRECSAMKRLPIIRGEHQLPPPLLTKINGEIWWWDSLEWDHPFAKTLFQPFFIPDNGVY